MSIARKILTNTIAQIAGKVVNALLSILTIKIITNYLSLSGYGEYTTIYEFLAFFGIASDLGLFTIAVREMTKDESKIPRIIGNVLTLRTFLAVSTMIVAIASVWFIPKYQGTHIPFGVAIASLTVLIAILTGTLSSVLQVHLKMEKASWAGVIGKLVSVAYMLYIIFIAIPQASDVGFYHLIGAGVIGNMVMLAVTYWYTRKLTVIRYQFDWDLCKKVLLQALPYGVALILNTIYFRIDTIMLSFMKNSEEVGIYSVGMRMLEAIAVMPLYFMNSVLPVLTKYLEEKNEKYRAVIQYSFDFLTMGSFPLVIGGCVLAYPIIFLVSTPEYLSRLSEGFYGSDIALQILLWAMIFSFLNILFSFLLIAVNQQKKLLWINLVGVIFNIGSNYFIIPAFGFRGAAVNSVVSEILILIGAVWMSRKYIQYTISLKTTFKSIFSAVVMGAVVWALRDVTYTFLENKNVFLLIIIGIVVYVAMLYFTGAISKEMLKMIKKGEPTSEQI